MEKILDEWASKSEEYIHITNFLQWIQDEKDVKLNHGQTIDENYGVCTIPLKYKLDDYIYEYLGIDRNKLEKARKQILQDIQKARSGE